MDFSQGQRFHLRSTSSGQWSSRNSLIKIPRATSTDIAVSLLRPSRLGKPSRKRYVTARDGISIVTSMISFTIALISVMYARAAVFLGQTNQLVVLGLAIAVMGSVTLGQAQCLLITLEARFGQSWLQNYDAILRNKLYGPQTSVRVRSALILLFLLPLGLSSLYKQFVGGQTTVPLSTEGNISYGPTNPPGLYGGSGHLGFINATSPLFSGKILPPLSDPKLNTSYGFNMHIVNETVTAMLDTPTAYHMSSFQSSLTPGSTLRLSAMVNATYASLNSTPTSPERSNPDYWNEMDKRLEHWDWMWNNHNGGAFVTWASFIDQSFFMISVVNNSINSTSQIESFGEKAAAFNIYRGTATGNWLITRSSIFLESATDFDTTWSPETQHPELTTSECDASVESDPLQTVLYCNDNAMHWVYNYELTNFIWPYEYPTQTTLPPYSIWVAAVASMAWSSLAAGFGPDSPSFGRLTSNSRTNNYTLPYPYTYLSYQGQYSMSLTTPTVQQAWGLYTTLAIQPALLIAILVARIILFTTAVSENFGLINLLAGISHETVHILKGASFSGELSGPVRVQIILDDVNEDDDTGYLGEGNDARQVPTIKYVLNGIGKNSSLSSRPSGQSGLRERRQL